MEHFAFTCTVSNEFSDKYQSIIIIIIIIIIIMMMMMMMIIIIIETTIFEDDLSVASVSHKQKPYCFREFEPPKASIPY